MKNIRIHGLQWIIRVSQTHSRQQQQLQQDPTSLCSISPGCWTLASSAPAVHVDAVTPGSWWHSSETGCRWRTLRSHRGRQSDNCRLVLVDGDHNQLTTDAIPAYCDNCNDRRCIRVSLTHCTLSHARQTTAVKQCYYRPTCLFHTADTDKTNCLVLSCLVRVGSVN